MTANHKADKAREPRAFSVDDITPEKEIDVSAGEAAASRRQPKASARALTASDLQRGIRWGALLLSAATALASLAAGLWFMHFVSVALERNDWVGWLAFSLLAVMALALVGLLVRELIGFRRLARLSRLRASVKKAIQSGAAKDERAVVADLLTHYRGRADMAWGLARVADHAGDVLAPGELLRLADRELLAPVDKDARQVILQSGKRVATATAISPILWLALGYVLVENVRMFRALSALYGGRPGLLGALRLARNVVGHVIATGGVAMTDDLLGQFIGQDVLRRLSRRLGEGAFNGALTARLGVVAVEVIRPLPFLDSPPLRVREIFAELFRSLRGGDRGSPPA